MAFNEADENTERAGILAELHRRQNYYAQVDHGSIFSAWGTFKLSLTAGYRSLTGGFAHLYDRIAYSEHGSVALTPVEMRTAVNAMDVAKRLETECRNAGSSEEREVLTRHLHNVGDVTADLIARTGDEEGAAKLRGDLEETLGVAERQFFTVGGRDRARLDAAIEKYGVVPGLGTLGDRMKLATRALGVDNLSKDAGLRTKAAMLDLVDLGAIKQRLESRQKNMHPDIFEDEMLAVDRSITQAKTKLTAALGYETKTKKTLDWGGSTLKWGFGAGMTAFGGTLMHSVGTAFAGRDMHGEKLSFSSRIGRIALSLPKAFLVGTASGVGAAGMVGVVKPVAGLFIPKFAKEGAAATADMLSRRSVTAEKLAARMISFGAEAETARDAASRPKVSNRAQQAETAPNEVSRPNEPKGPHEAVLQDAENALAGVKAGISQDQSPAKVGVPGVYTFAAQTRKLMQV